jgi:hypothetical protein
MDIQNFRDLMTELQNRTPFRPFRIVTMNGNKYEIDFPGAFAYRDGTAVCITPGGAPGWFDHESVSVVVGDLAHTKSEHDG